MACLGQYGAGVANPTRAAATAPLSPALRQDAAEMSREGGGQLFSDQPPLSGWDLRMVFPLGQSASNTAATVALRRGAMLVSFPPMRGVLTASKCFVLLEQVGARQPWGDE